MHHPEMINGQYFGERDVLGGEGLSSTTSENVLWIDIFRPIILHRNMRSKVCMSGQAEK